MAQRTTRYLELQILANTSGLSGPLARGGRDVQRFAQQVEQANRPLGAMGTRASGARAAVGGLGGTVRGLAGDVGGLAVRVAEANSSFSDFSRGGGAVVATATAIGASFGALEGIKFDAKMEQLRVGFTDLLGSGEEADRMLRRLYDLAKNTPFEFQDVTAAERKLVGLGVGAEKAYKWLGIVGDAVAGVGGGAAELERVTRAIAQIQAKGKLSMEELNQLGEAGIPAQEIIRKVRGETRLEFSEHFLPGNQIPAKEALDALMAGMDKRYEGMAERQSETFLGQVDKLKDNARQAAGAAMEPMFLALKDMLPVLSEMVQGAAPKIAAGTRELTSAFQEMAEDGSLRSMLEDAGFAINLVLKPIGAVAKVTLDAVHAFAELPDPTRHAIITFGLASLAARKLGGSFAWMGGEAAKATAQVAGLGVASTAQAGTANAAGAPYRNTFALDGPRTFVSSAAARQAGATGFSALGGRAYATGQIDQMALKAQRRASEATRNAVQARQALADAEIQTARAERAVALQRHKLNSPTSLAARRAAEADLAASRETQAAAAERLRAAEADKTAARNQLARTRTAQSSARQVAWEARQRQADAALAAGGGLTARQLAREQARNAGRGRLAGGLAYIAPNGIRLPAGVGKGAAIAGAGGAAGTLLGGSPLEAALTAGGLGLVGGPWTAFGAAGAAALGTAIKGWIEKHGRAEGDRLGREMAPGFSRATRTGVGNLEKDNERDRRHLRYLLPKYQDGEFADQLRGDIAARYRKQGQLIAEATMAGAREQGGRRLSANWIGMEALRGLRNLAPAAQAEGAKAVVSMAREMEAKGDLPKGSAKAIAKRVVGVLGGLRGELKGVGGSAIRAFAAGLDNPSVVQDARKLVDKLKNAYGDLPDYAEVTADSAAGILRDIAANLRSRLPQMTREGRKAAERDIRALERQISRLKSTAASDLAKVGDYLADAFKAITGNATSARDAIKGFASVAGTAATTVKPLMDLLGGSGDVGDIASLISGGSDTVDALRKLSKGGKKRRGGGWNRYQGGGAIPTLMSGGERVLEPADVAAWDAAMPGALGWIAANQAAHFAGGGPVGMPMGWEVPGPSDRDGTFVPATPGSFVLTGHGQQLAAGLMGYAGGGRVVRGRVSVFGPPLEGAGRTANGMSSSQAGIALNIDPGTDSGWNNAITNKWVMARQRFLVRIGSHRAILPMIDKGPAGSTGRAIDVTGAGARKMGLNPSRFPTDQTGTATLVGKGTTLNSLGYDGASTDTVDVKLPRTLGRSKTRRGLLDDAFGSGYDAAQTGWFHGLAPTYRNPVSGQIREALDAQADSYSKTISLLSRTGGEKAARSAAKTYVDPKSGAVVTPSPIKTASGQQREAQAVARAMGLSITSTTGGTHAKNSWHYKGRAFDASNGSAPTPQMMRFAKWARARYPNALELFYDPFGGYKNGKSIGPIGGHANHVHLALRRGGFARMAAGSGVKFGPKSGLNWGRTPGPTKAIGSALAKVEKGATDAALDRLDAALADASTRRIEGVAKTLLSRIRKGGDARMVARLQAAYDKTTAEIGQRVGERVYAAGRILESQDRLQGNREARQFVMQGLQPGSSAGMALGIQEDESFLRGNAAARKKLESALAIANRNRQREKADEISAQIQELDDRDLGARLSLDQAKRELPRRQVQEALAEFDWRGAMAALTPDGADDAAVQAERERFARQALEDANRRGDHEAATQLAQELASLNTTLQEGREREQALIDSNRQLADEQARTNALILHEKDALAAGLAALLNGSIGGAAAAGMATTFTPGQKVRY